MKTGTKGLQNLKQFRAVDSEATGMTSTSVMLTDTAKSSLKDLANKLSSNKSLAIRQAIAFAAANSEEFDRFIADRG